MRFKRGMMGFEQPEVGPKRYIEIDLEERVRKNHPLRRIKEIIDFDFVYEEVKDTYGNRGHVSIPPPVILKLMVLLVFYNVRSERELMETLPERIDWLWFLGYALDTAIPDHSVLSKARRRWGPVAFKAFFERVVWQCVEAGLVDGTKVFIDSSLIEADASNNSVVDTLSLKRHLNERYRELERRLDVRDRGDKEKEELKGGVNRRYISMTDPEAAIVRHSGGKAELSYKIHRSVDPAYEIITATEVTAGDINEAHRMTSLMETHQDTTGFQVEIVVADSKYGTVDNFISCYDRGVKAHFPDIKAVLDKTSRNRAIYGNDKFTYDRATDTYLCPAGARLKRRTFHESKQSIDYSAPGRECSKCQLRTQCTRNKYSRSIMRHLRQEELDRMRAVASTAASKRDIRTRQHLMERSFARSKRYGFDRSRWRGLWRNQVQEYITAAIQNIEVLIRYAKDPIRKIMAVPMRCRGLSACLNLG